MSTTGLLLKASQRTPIYTSWQQEVWLTHCNEPCAFIGYADTKTIEPLMEKLHDDIENNGMTLIFPKRRNDQQSFEQMRVWSYTLAP